MSKLQVENVENLNGASITAAAFGRVDAAGGLANANNLNFGSVTKNGTGSYTLFWDTQLSNGAPAVVVTAQGPFGVTAEVLNATSTFVTYVTRTSAGAPVDVLAHIVAFSV